MAVAQLCAHKRQKRGKRQCVVVGIAAFLEDYTGGKKRKKCSADSVSWQKWQVFAVTRNSAVMCTPERVAAVTFR